MKTLQHPYTRLCLTILLATITLPVIATQAAPQAICNSQDDCLAKLYETPADPMGVLERDTALSKRLRDFAPEVIPALVVALTDSNERAAALAADTLSDLPELDAAYFPEIKAGLDRGLSGLAPALCLMAGETPAQEAVARYLLSESDPHSQEAYAVGRCGTRAIPHLVEAVRSHAGGSRERYAKLASLMPQLGESRRPLASELLELAKAPEAPPDVTLGALTVIAGMEVNAPELGRDLLQLRTDRPELSGAIDDALVGVRSPALARVFIERLERGAYPGALRDLAETGRAGADASPTVIRLLTHKDWDVRVAAARTLGYIGDVSAADALIPLLSDDQDVRLNRVAAVSLGQLRAQAAIPALSVTAANHWYPPVRNAAKAAIQEIVEDLPPKERLPGWNFAVEFFAYWGLGKKDETCKHAHIPRIAEPPQQKRYASKDPGVAETLAFMVEKTTLVPVSTEPNKEASPGKPQGSDYREQVGYARHEPTVALRVDQGWLVGSNQGEWGGALAYTADQGATKVVLMENVEDIYSFGDQIIALTGLAHMGTNIGRVYRLTRRAGGTWQADLWRVLPGAPQHSSLTQSGELLIDTGRGGPILLARDGTFRMAPCAD